VFGRFGLHALRAAKTFAGRFDDDLARALFAGAAGHAMLPLDRAPSGAFGIALTVFAHAAGWPVARGGSQRLADAMVAHLRSLGGEIDCGREVRSMDELPQANAYLFDTTPRALAWIARDRLPAAYLRKLRRFRYGPGIFKVDWALDGPVPWKAQECARAGTVHLGGTFDEIARAEADVAAGRLPERPYMIAVQASVFDDSRAPAGKHTLWAYCHVPSGSTADMTEAMERQVERFAPGFGDLVLARSVRGPADVERYDANYVGGDINSGLQDLRQHFGRPVMSPNPYATPNRAIYLCSSSTPPGGGVHGMSGFWAARSALRRAF
jgi:phytoene dehydrogenase-like protein